MGKKNKKLRAEIKNDSDGKAARLQLFELVNYKDGEQRIALTFDSHESKQDFLKLCSLELKQSRSDEEKWYPLQVILRGGQTKITLFRQLLTAMSQFETIDKKSYSDLEFQFTAVNELARLQRECGMDDVMGYLEEHPQCDSLLSYLADYHLACVATDGDASRLARECVDAHVSLIVTQNSGFPYSDTNRYFYDALKKMWNLDKKEHGIKCDLDHTYREYFKVAFQIRQSSRQQAKPQLQAASTRLFSMPTAAVHSPQHSSGENCNLTS